jgi:hypothetical protein
MNEVYLSILVFVALTALEYLRLHSFGKPRASGQHGPSKSTSRLPSVLEGAGTTAAIGSALVAGTIYLVRARFDSALFANHAVGLDPELSAKLKFIAVTCGLISIVLATLILIVVLHRKEAWRNFWSEFWTGEWLLPQVNIAAFVTTATLILLFRFGVLPSGVMADSKPSPVVIVPENLLPAFDLFLDSGMRFVTGSPSTLDSVTQSAIRSARERGDVVYVVKPLDSLFDGADSIMTFTVEITTIRPDASRNSEKKVISGGKLKRLVELREVVYARVLGTSPETSALDLSTMSVAAFGLNLKGLLDMNHYSEAGLSRAIADFEQAAKLDSSYAAPVLREANCLVFEIDRGFDLPNAVSNINNVERLLVVAEQRNPSVRIHPLYLKVKGDLDYVLGRLRLKEYYGATDVTPLTRDELHLALNHFAAAKLNLVRAAVLSQSYYKLRYNAGTLYASMARTYISLNYRDSAIEYLGLSERATKDASRLFAYPNGPIVGLGTCKFYRYLLSPGVPSLLNDAESIFVAIDTGSSYRPLDSQWVASARYGRALVAAARGDIAGSRTQLQRADSMATSDILQEAATDPDLKVLRSPEP